MFTATNSAQNPQSDSELDIVPCITITSSEDSEDDIVIYDSTDSFEELTLCESEEDESDDYGEDDDDEESSCDLPLNDDDEESGGEVGRRLAYPNPSTSFGSGKSTL